MNLLKHPKERYILLAITIAIPVAFALLYFGVALWITSISPDAKDYTNAVVNDTHVTFNLTTKTYHSDCALTSIGEYSHYINSTDLDEMQFDRRYTCQITSRDDKWYYKYFNVSNYTIGRCVEL